jgi:WD40 repeat protein/ankyrin repeat protein
MEDIVSMNENLLASGSSDCSIKLWDVGARGLKNTLIGHTNYVWSVAFSPCGSTVASGSRDESIKLWDAYTYKLKGIMRGHTDSVDSVAFSPCGRTIASGSADNSIKLWDAETGDLKNTLQEHTDTVNSVTFSPCGKIIASGSDDCSIKLWDAETGNLKMTLTGHTDSVKSVAFSPCGSTVASGSPCGSTLASGSPCGSTLASGSRDNSIKLWDAGTYELKGTLTGHTNAVNSVAFSPCGSTIASGSSDCSIKLWDAGTYELKGTTQGHTKAVTSVAFNPCGSTIAAGSEDSIIALWDARTGDHKGTTRHICSVNSIAFPPLTYDMAANIPRLVHNHANPNPELKPLEQIQDFDRSNPDAYMILALAESEGIHNDITDDGMTAMQLAAQRDMGDVLRVLINNGADVRVKGKGENNKTPLEIAILHKSSAAVKVLMEKNNLGAAAIHFAIDTMYPIDKIKQDIFAFVDDSSSSSSSSDIFNFEAPFRIPTIEEGGETSRKVYISPLLLACYSYYYCKIHPTSIHEAEKRASYMVRIIKILLEKSADPFRKSSKYSEVLEYSVLSAYTACYLWGLNEIIDIIGSPPLTETNKEVYTQSLIFAMMKDRIDLVSKLFSSDKQFEFTENTLVQRQHFSAKDTNVSPLYMAVYMDKKEWVEIILNRDKGESLTITAGTHINVVPPGHEGLPSLDPVTMACYMGSTDSLPLLFNRVKPPNFTEYLKYAVFGGQTGILDIIRNSWKDREVSVEVENILKNQQQPFPIKCEHADLVSWLIANGRRDFAYQWEARVDKGSEAYQEISSIISTHRLLYPPILGSKALKTNGGIFTNTTTSAAPQQHPHGEGLQPDKKEDFPYIDLLKIDGANTVVRDIYFQKPRGKNRHYKFIMIKGGKKELVERWKRLVETAGGDQLCSFVSLAKITKSIETPRSYTCFAFRGSDENGAVEPVGEKRKKREDSFIYERIDAVCIVQEGRGSLFYDLLYFCVYQKNKRIRGLGHPFMTQVLAELAGITRTAKSKRCLVSLTSSEAGSNFYPKGKFVNGLSFVESPTWVIGGKLFDEEPAIEDWDGNETYYYISICNKPGEAEIENYSEQDHSIAFQGYRAHRLGRCGRCSRITGRSRFL